MQLAVVKAELAAAVEAASIPELDVYSFVPDAPHPPCFYPGECTFAPNNAFGNGGFDIVDITCRVLTSAADDKDGQARLDKYLSRSGEYSIRAALLAARGAPGELALNDAADDLKIVRIDGYRMITSSTGPAFYGAQIVVQVIGSSG